MWQIHKVGYLDTTGAWTYPTIERVCANAGYCDTFLINVDETLGIVADISEETKPHEWEKLPWRLVVEHTLA